MILLFFIDEVCCVCCKACLDTFGEHTIHCRKFVGFKYSNDLVRDVIFDIFQGVIHTIYEERGGCRFLY